jgi:hypothetical protein
MASLETIGVVMRGRYLKVIPTAKMASMMFDTHLPQSVLAYFLLINLENNYLTISHFLQHIHSMQTKMQFNNRRTTTLLPAPSTRVAYLAGIF